MHRVPIFAASAGFGAGIGCIAGFVVETVR
jgi:hypothetical protein